MQLKKFAYEYYFSPQDYMEDLVCDPQEDLSCTALSKDDLGMQIKVYCGWYTNSMKVWVFISYCLFVFLSSEVKDT